MGEGSGVLVVVVEDAAREEVGEAEVFRVDEVILWATLFIFLLGVLGIPIIEEEQVGH